MKAKLVEAYRPRLLKPLFSEKDLECITDYLALMVQRYGMVELVFRNCYPTFLTYAHHPIHAEDRMMNPKLDFPVAFSFGDRDFLGSEGADEIVRNNKYFRSGES